VRFAEGSLIAAETGVEHVSRPTGIYCNDSVLDAQSNGVRVNVAGNTRCPGGSGCSGGSASGPASTSWR
jgi:hypothetical protein